MNTQLNISVVQLRSGIKSQIQTLLRATLKMELKDPNRKLLDCGTRFMISNHITADYVLGKTYIQYNTMCFFRWNIIICATSNVPGNIYFIHQALHLQRLDVKCCFSSCRLHKKAIVAFYVIYSINKFYHL